MGQCVSGRSPPTGKELDVFKEPPDTAQLKDAQLPKLSFQAQLANVKIKNCPYSSIEIKFNIENVQSFGLSKKDIRNDGSAKWKIEHRLGFQMTEYELRKSFLILQFMDDSGKVVGNVKINMYYLSTGPYHQDFAIDSIKKRSSGRISFDFRVSQIIELNLSSMMCQIELAKKHPGQKFNFSVKTIVEHSSLISMPSYTVLVMLDNKEKNQAVSLMEEQHSSGRRKKTFKVQKKIEEGKNLVWSRQECEQLPSLTMNIQAFDLHHACFQILLWKIDQKSADFNQGQKSQLYAECYISFQKLFLQQCRKVVRDGQEFEQRTIDVEEKLWNHGKEVGHGRFKFHITNQKYIRQQLVCVRTEQGILKSSPVFDPNNKIKYSQTTKCEQIAELMKLSEQIETNSISLGKFQSEAVTSHQIRTLQIKIQKGLKQMIPLLQKSIKESVVFYNYSSPQQLQRAQKIFINIGMKILDYIDEDDPLIGQICWGILIALLRRSQFMLCYVGFDEKQKISIAEDQTNQFLKKKIQVAIQYQEWIHKLLQLALNSLNVKGHESQRTFAELFCVYAYFRIPSFRNQILDVITREDDPQIPEWRGLQFSLNQDVNYEKIKEDANTFTVLFDWVNSFHKCLEKEEKYQINNSELNDILQKDEWRVRMSRRGNAFIFFVRFWVMYVEQIAVKSKDIQWKYFPGYNRLIRAFLVEMKLRHILQYPDALKLTLTTLLTNEKLLNAFIAILLTKGNMNEPLTVLKTIQLMSQMFQALTDKKRKVPHIFNYLQFFKAIKIVLESEFSYAIAQALTMIYTHFPLFSNEFKRNLSMYLLGKVFFRLFLHWSHNVRIVFYYLITIRIYHQTQLLHGESRQKGFGQEDNLNCRFKHQFNEDVKVRYEKLMNIITNAERMKLEEGKGQIRIIYEKDLFKKMKKKLLKRKQLERSQKGRNGSNESQMKTTDNDFIKHNYKNSFDEERQELMSNLNIESSRVLSDKNNRTGGHGTFKYSIEQLQKPRIQRTHSQVMMKPTISTAIRDNGRNREEVVKIKSSSFKFRHEVIDKTAVPNHHKNMPHSNYLYDDTDFQIKLFTTHQLVYIGVSLRQFNEVNQIFVNFERGGARTAPKVKVGMIPIDQKQIRPDKIDDW